MTLRPAEKRYSFEPLVPLPPEQIQGQGRIRPYLDAAMRLENDVLAVWDMFTAPTFPADPAFDNYTVTRASPYWDNYRNAFIGVNSQAQWDFIAAKIERETKDRELLASAGVGGMAAAMFAGVLSPTMLIPGVTPIRGARGVAAAAGLGALAAMAQEVPLRANQITRSNEESAFAIGAGAIFGAVIGGAVEGLRRIEVRVPKVDGRVSRFTEEGRLQKIFENDMANGRRPIAIPHSPRTVANEITVDLPEAVAGTRRVYVVDAGSAAQTVQPNFAVVTTDYAVARAYGPGAVRYIDLPETSISTYTKVDPAEPNSLLWAPVEEVGQAVPVPVREVAEDTPAVVQQGPLVRTPAASLSAAAADGPDAGTLAPGVAGARDVNALAQLSPVAQTIAQDEFPLARRMMTKLSTAGLELVGNRSGIASAPGGTVESLTHLYDTYIAKLVQIVDEHWADYSFNGKVTGPFPATRATLRSNFRFNGEKLSKEEFNREVSRALINDGVHPVAQVSKAAQLIRSEIYDPILEQARDVKLFDQAELYDPGYLTRIYDTQKIDADPIRFLDIIFGHYKQILENDVASASERLQRQKAILDEYLADVSLDDSRAATLREELREEFVELGESDAEIQLTNLRRQALALRQEGGNKARVDQIKEEIAALRKANAPRIEHKLTLRRRMRNLNRSYFAVEEKRKNTLDRMEQIESAALVSLSGVMQQGMKLQKAVETLSPKKLGEEIARLQTRLEQAEQRFESWARRQAKAENQDEFMQAHGEALNGAYERLRGARRKLADTEDLFDNRDTLLEIMGDIEIEAADAVNTLNLNRGKRLAKLEEKLQKYTPEEVAAQVQKQLTRFEVFAARATERLQELGITDFDFASGTAAIDEIARERAEATVAKIMSLNNRIAGLHIIGEERGSELARVLSIDSASVFDFLVTDVERVVRSYVRQVGADIELKRAFGDVDAKDWFKDIQSEYFRVAEAAEKNGASAKELDALTKRFRQHERNLQASIARLRHLWGIPDNPEGFAARAAKTMLDLSTLRFMGSVAISSLPDLGRVVVKHGLRRTINDGFIPLINSFKEFKLSARELKLAGGALDPLIHSRAAGFADIMDEYVGHSIPEKTLHTLATKMGNIAGFDYWTSAMKQLNAVLDNAEMMDSIELVLKGGSNEEVAKATRYLAQRGINGDIAARIWQEVEKGGGGKVNGVWLPMTEAWEDQSMVRAYRAALRQSSDNTIITPGLELPLIANASLAQRVLFQFKSFALSSHTKALMAGLQQKDMALFNGATLSLALGAFSYYTWAATVGGSAYEQMQSAPIEKWWDEALARSGLLASFGEVQRIAERIPAIAPYANFSGTFTTARAGDNLTEALLGPSFDTLRTATNIVAGLHDPIQSNAHQLRTLIPLQNVFYLRWLFTMVEDAVKAELPESREQ